MKRGWTLKIAALLILLNGTVATPATDGMRTSPPAARVKIVFFWGERCSHCAEAKPFLRELQGKYPQLEVQEYEVSHHPENIRLLKEMTRAAGGEYGGVPTFFIDQAMFTGFNPETARLLEARIREHPAVGHRAGGTSKGSQHPGEGTITLPLLGAIEPSTLSLPVFTLVIAALDSFNPCAFFVLLFLLSLLVHAHSRARMAIIGGTFVLFSGGIYFIFMAAWLNLFLLTENMAAVTTIAALVALLVAGINIKDFFFFKEGVTLSIPDSARPRLLDRMRGLVKAASLPAMLAGTSLLAIGANGYELLCTAGFPMVFTRVLTLNHLSTTGYYLYLALYNVVYIIPLAIIVGIFAVTLGSRKLSEWQGRVLKLVSGIMMLGLGLVLLVNPDFLASPVISAGLLAATLLTAAIVVILTRKFAPHLVRHEDTHHNESPGHGPHS
jgi:thiol-disulfide isomerase/thioredoxin